jgi:hypothetical protein
MRYGLLGPQEVIGDDEMAVVLRRSSSIRSGSTRYGLPAVS